MEFAKQETYLLHSKTSGYRELVSKTKSLIRNVLSSFKLPYVAFSGGKDSTVMLDLLIKERPEITVIHWDFGPYYIPRNIYNSLVKNAGNIGVKNLRIHTSKKYHSQKRRAINVLGSDFLGKLVPSLAKEGFDLAFIGLRAKESYKRRAKTKNYVVPFQSHMMNCYPLRDWSYKDVWAYIVQNNVPYLSEFYDKYGLILGDKNTRFCTFFDPEFKNLGTGNLDGIIMVKNKNDDICNLKTRQ